MTTEEKHLVLLVASAPFLLYQVVCWWAGLRDRRIIVYERLYDRAKDPKHYWINMTLLTALIVAWTLTAIAIVADWIA